MAIWDRYIQRQIEKAAPNLPAGAQVTQFTPEQLAGIASQMYGTGVLTPLDRNPWLPGVPFGPSQPLMPSAINPVGEDGRPDPRRWEYPVAWNIFVTEQRLVPWKVLRIAADQIDILRRCVEVLKAKLISLDWDIVLSEAASEMIRAESGGDHLRAMQKARDEFTEDIARVREFWMTPDRINGLGFKDWLMMALEDLIVLDALAIYPHPDNKGALHSFEILDATTIKPLLDDRGMRPHPPYPAYQQILYGFPRGEFLATSDDPEQDGTFSADELIYLVRNRRTWTPYGFSPVERALPLADIYLKRQQWLRAEFTDGVMPDLMFIPRDNFSATPELIKAYEAILNDDLAGQTEQRKRARIVPPGIDPADLTGHSEKFNPAFDEYFIKGITGHFGVLPTEIGYADGGTLGGAGQQMGEAESATNLGLRPWVEWLSQQLSDISYKFLGMPRELEFIFDGGRTTETSADAQRRDIEIKGGQRTLNEARSDTGLPLIDSPYADYPMMFSPSGLLFVTPEGLEPASTPQMQPGMPGLPDSPDASPASPEDAPTSPDAAPASPDASQDGEEADKKSAEQDSIQQEVRAFLKWARKGTPERDFEFKTLDAVHAAALNRAAREGDLDTAKAIGEMVLGKAPAAGTRRE